LAKVSDVASYLGFGWEYATSERDYLKWGAVVFLAVFAGLALAVGMVAASVLSFMVSGFSAEGLIASGGAAIAGIIILLLVVFVLSSYWNVILARGTVSKARGKGNAISAMKHGAWGMALKFIALSIIIAIVVTIVNVVLELISPVLAQIVGLLISIPFMFAAYALVSGDRKFWASIPRSVELVAANPVTALAAFVASVVAVIVFAIVGVIIGVALALIAIAALGMGGLGQVIAVVVGIITAIFALFFISFITLFNTGVIASLYASLDAETGGRRAAAGASEIKAAPARRAPVRRAARKPARRTRK